MEILIAIAVHLALMTPWGDERARQWAKEAPDIIHSTLFVVAKYGVSDELPYDDERVQLALCLADTHITAWTSNRFKGALTGAYILRTAARCIRKTMGEKK